MADSSADSETTIPVGSPSAWFLTTDQILQRLSDALAENREVRASLPGLKDLLDDYLDDEVDLRRVEFHRRLLRVFRDAPRDSTYGSLLAKLEGSERERVTRFVDDDAATPDECGAGFEHTMSLGVREHLRDMLRGKPGAGGSLARVGSGGFVHVAGLSAEEFEARDGPLYEFVRGLAALFHCGRLTAAVTTDLYPDEVLVYKDTEFHNWGLTEQYTPVYTCIPSTVAGVQRIVRYAKSRSMGVRCAGFRHSWAPVFGRNGQILISLLGLHEATAIPNTTAFSFIPQRAPTELESIEVVSGTPRKKGNTLVRVGVAVTNERLRRWCVASNRYTLPVNTIMVEMTMGGTNAPICHGSGIGQQTLSDLVRKVEYVDANGELRVVDEPEHLRVASGCFGLMGVITHLTLEFAPMTYAILEAKHVPTIRAIPPPPGMSLEDIPPALRLELTAEERKHDQEAFERHATRDYYNEWFWFPFSDTIWVNCWDHTTDEEGVEDYPNEGAIFFSFVTQFALNVLQSAPILRDFIDKLGLNEAATTLIGRAAKFALPEKRVKTYLNDALHFQRGIQNVRVLNLEVSIPLVPAKADPTKPDWAIVQKAWWDAILKCYEHSDTCPQRMPLEMRIMGGSDVVMAPQRGNHLGTCAIEILTLYSAKEDWIWYAQEVLDRWMALTDSEGRKLRTRPHWAKQWKEFRVDGKPWAETLRADVYKDEIAEFKRTLTNIGRFHGWELADLKERFSNDFFDWFYFDDVLGHGASGGTYLAKGASKRV